MQKGDWFRVASRPGQVYQYQYEVRMEDSPFHEGDHYHVAYGGSKDPKGQRQFESFPADTNFISTKAPFIRDKDRED